MALAALPVGERAVAALGKAVTADLIVIGGKWFRKVRVKTPAKNKRGWKWSEELVPIDVELHVNPLAMALGALGVAVAAFFAVGRVKVPSPAVTLQLAPWEPGFPGTVDVQWTEVYKGPLADEWEGWKKDRRCAAIQAEYGDLIPMDKLGRRGRDLIVEANAIGCPWASSPEATNEDIWIIDGVPTEDPTKEQICKKLYDAHLAARRAKNWTDAARFYQQAQAQGCAWAGG